MLPMLEFHTTIMPETYKILGYPMYLLTTIIIILVQKNAILNVSNVIIYSALIKIYDPYGIA